MTYRYQGWHLYGGFSLRLILCSVFLLFFSVTFSESGIAIVNLLMLGMALLLLHESWAYLRAILCPVILKIKSETIEIQGIGTIPLDALRRFSFSFSDTVYGLPGLRGLISVSRLTVAAEKDGEVITKKFRILPDACMSAKKHEILSALAAKFPGIEKSRNEKSPKVADVYLDFENNKPTQNH